MALQRQTSKEQLDCFQINRNLELHNAVKMNQNTPSLHERIGGRKGLSLLLRRFYADVRQHHLIGPIFNERIEDWPAHLEKIGGFWARVTGGPSDYSGRMPAKHFGLALEPHHFAAWLELWQHNCRCYLEPQEAREMIQLAQEIGRRLGSILSNQGDLGIAPGAGAGTSIPIDS